MFQKAIYARTLPLTSPPRYFLLAQMHVSEKSATVRFDADDVHVADGDRFHSYLSASTGCTCVARSAG